MARALRIEVVGGRYHVTARGNTGNPIFRKDGDRLHFLELLAELPSRFANATQSLAGRLAQLTERLPLRRAAVRSDASPYRLGKVIIPTLQPGRCGCGPRG